MADEIEKNGTTPDPGMQPLDAKAKPVIPNAESGTPPSDKPSGGTPPPPPADKVKAEPSALQLQFQKALQVMKDVESFNKGASKYTVPEFSANFTNAINAFAALTKQLESSELKDSWGTMHKAISEVDDKMKQLMEEPVTVKEIDDGVDENGNVKKKTVEEKQMSMLTRYFDGINKVLNNFKSISETIPAIAYGDISNAFIIAENVVKEMNENIPRLTNPLTDLWWMAVNMQSGGEHNVWWTMITPDPSLQKQVWKVQQEWKAATVDENGTTKEAHFEDVIKNGIKQMTMTNDGNPISPFGWLEYCIGGVFAGLDVFANMFSDKAEDLDFNPSNVTYVADQYCGMLEAMGPAIKRIGKTVETQMAEGLGSGPEGAARLQSIHDNVKNMTAVFTMLDDTMKKAFAPMGIMALIKQYATIHVMTELYKAFLSKIDSTLVMMYLMMNTDTNGNLIEKIQKAEKKDEKESGVKVDDIVSTDAPKTEEVAKATAEVKATMPMSPWAAIPDMCKKMDEVKKVPASFSAVAAEFLKASALIGAALATAPLFSTFLYVGVLGVMTTVNIIAKVIAGMNTSALAMKIFGGMDVKNIAGNIMKNVMPIFEPIIIFAKNLRDIALYFIETGILMAAFVVALPIFGVGFVALIGMMSALLLGVVGLGVLIEKIKSTYKPVGKEKEFSPFQPILDIVKGAMVVVGALIVLGLAVTFALPLMLVGFVAFNVITLACLGILLGLAIISEFMKSDPTKPLLMFVGTMFLVTGLIALLGYLVMEHFTMMLAGLVALGVLLVAMQIVINIANSINPATMVKAMISLLLACAVIGVCMLIGYLTVKLGEMIGGEDGLISFGLGVAAIVVIGVLATALGWLATVVAPALAGAEPGLLLILAVMGTLLATVAACYAIIQVTMSIGDLIPTSAGDKVQAVRTNMEILKEALSGLCDAIINGVGWYAAVLPLAMPGIMSLGVMAKALVNVVDLIAAFAKLRFYDEKEGKYIELSKDDIKTACENVNTVVTAVTQSIIDLIAQHPEYFQDPLIGDAPIKVAFDNIGKVGDILWKTANGLKDLSKINIDEALPAVRSFFANFGGIVDAALGIDKESGKTLVEGQKSLWGDIVTAFGGTNKQAPITEALQVLAKTFDDDAIAGVNNMFDIISKWNQIADKISTEEKMAEAVPRFKNFFRNFAEMIEVAIGIDHENGKELSREGGIFGFYKAILGFNTKEAPLTEALGVLNKTFDDDSMAGINNMFSIVDRWNEMSKKMADKAAKNKQNAESMKDQISAFSGMFSGPDEVSLKSWSEWSNTVGTLAKNLQDVVESFDKMGEALEKNSDLIASFCANVIKLIEEETGLTISAPGSEEDTAEKKEESKSTAFHNELKHLVEDLISGIEGIKSKLDSPLSVKTDVGHFITTRNM